MYEVAEFKELIEKAKITRNLPLLEQVHTAILEWLAYLQTCHEKNIKVGNYRLKSEIEKLEELNILIFGIFSRLQDHIDTLESKLKTKHKRM